MNMRATVPLPRSSDVLARDVVAREQHFAAHIRAGRYTRLEVFRIMLRKERRRAHPIRAALRQVFFSRDIVTDLPEHSEARFGESTQSPTSWRIEPRHRWIGRTFLALVAIPVSAVAAHVLNPAATEIMASTVVRTLPSSGVSEIDAARTCARVQPVLDAGGTLVGTVPVANCQNRPFLTSPVSRDAAGQMHRAWWALEGEYHMSPETFLGLNLKGWARATWHNVNPWDTRTDGGSSPIETAIKNLRGQAGGQNLQEKIGNAFHVLSYFGNLPSDDRTRDRFVSESIPCVSGAQGSSFGYRLAGDLCPRFLFAKSADELNWAERCLWAATALYPYKAVGRNGTSPTTATDSQESRRKIRDRAANLCVPRVASRLAWSEGEIEAWRVKVFEVEFPVRSANGAESVDFSATLPGLDFALRDELKLVDISAALHLSVDQQQQRHANDMVHAASEGVPERLAPGFCLFNCEVDQTPADILVVLAEIDGDRLLIRNVVSNKHHLLSGPLRRDDVGYEYAPTHRGVGSTNKAWILPLLVKNNVSRLCDLVPVGRGGVQASGSPDEANCADGRGLVGLTEAIARSVNSGFADGVYKLGIQFIRDYFVTLGFDLAPAAQSDGEFVNAVVLGNGVTAAPALLMRNMASFYRGYRGEEPVSSLPSLITRSTPERGFDWRDVGISAGILRRAGTLLKAPIESPSGTLRSLGPVLARHGCYAGIGKTGTSDSATEQAVRDKIVLAAFECAGRSYVAYAQIGSPSMHSPLGNVQAADLARLIDAVLTAGSMKSGDAQ